MTGQGRFASEQIVIPRRGFCVIVTFHPSRLADIVDILGDPRRQSLAESSFFPERPKIKLETFALDTVRPRFEFDADSLPVRLSGDGAETRHLVAFEHHLRDMGWSGENLEVARRLGCLACQAP